MDLVHAGKPEKNLCSGKLEIGNWRSEEDKIKGAPYNEVLSNYDSGCDKASPEIT